MDFDPIYSSYQIFYSDYSLLDYPPEAFYYSARSGYDTPAEVTVSNCYSSFIANGIFNIKIFQDVILGV